MCEAAGPAPGRGPRRVKTPRTWLRRCADAAAPWFLLTKPRIVGLLLVTCLCSMVVAAGRLPGPGVAAPALLGLALAAGGSAAVNMWFDRDIDAHMERTRGRPLPTGRLHPAAALIFGIVLGALGTVLLLGAVGPAAAAVTAAGYLYYAVFYTMVLKRRTDQAVVIGGLAGALPCVVGWLAVSGTVAPTAIGMAAIVFLWTPPHFWPLALYRRDDYTAAGLPMLPVTRGETVTRQNIVRYAVILVVMSPWLAAFGRVGNLYIAAAVMAGLLFLRAAVLLQRERLPADRRARHTFRMSLAYLSILFLAMALSALGVGLPLPL